MKHATSPDSIDCLLIIPYLALVKFNHDIEGAFGTIFVWILQQRQNEVLQLFVYVYVLGLLVKVFKVLDDAGVQKLAQLFVLAAEKLKEHGQDHSGRDDILAAHDFQASYQGHSDLGVQD